MSITRKSVLEQITFPRNVNEFKKASEGLRAHHFRYLLPDLEKYKNMDDFQIRFLKY